MHHRKYWDEQSGKLGDKFDVESMVGVHAGAQHDMLLKRAEVLHNTLFGVAHGYVAENSGRAKYGEPVSGRELQRDSNSACAIRTC